MKTVHTFKELVELAGGWTTIDIRNDYTIGADHFLITYNGKSIMYQNDDIYNVASCSHHFNGISMRDLFKFNLSDYKNIN